MDYREQLKRVEADKKTKLDEMNACDDELRAMKPSDPRRLAVKRKKDALTSDYRRLRTEVAGRKRQVAA